MTIVLAKLRMCEFYTLRHTINTNYLSFMLHINQELLEAPSQLITRVIAILSVPTPLTCSVQITSLRIGALSGAQ